VAGTGGTITQKANPGSTSVLVVATGNLDLGTNGNLVLGTNATPSEAGSINASSGKIIAGTAGETEITKIWTAKGTGAGTVTIAGGANGAIITKTPAATGLVGGAAGLITQKAIADNNLTLDGVRVDLVTTAGKIVLTNSASNPGKVTLTSGTVIVCGTGEDVMGDPASIGGKAATIGGNLVCTYDDGDDDKLGSISGGLAPGNTITAGESNPVEIVKDAVLAE
jgi:hypothetical protein